MDSRQPLRKRQKELRARFGRADVEDIGGRRARTAIPDARVARMLDGLDAGLALFDSADGLLACNRRFRDLLYLAEDDTVSGASYERLLRLCVDNMVFACDACTKDPEAWLRERLEAAQAGGATPLRLVDGRYTELSEQPSDDGLTVVTIREVAAPEGDKGGYAEMYDVVMAASAYEEQAHYLADLVERLELELRAAEEKLAGNGTLQDYLAETRHDLEVRLQEVIAELKQEERARRTLEDDLLVAKQLARAAEQTKAEFLASMSHELRTPLNAIIGFSEVLLHRTFGPPANDKHAEYLDAIHDSGRDLLDKINRILDFADAASRRVHLNAEEVYLAELVRECAAEHLPVAHKMKIKLETQLSACPKVVIANRHMLTQVLRNLISNAVKFTPEQGRIAVAGARESATGDLLVTVRDTGIGMTADEIEVALESFRQADGRLARAHEGTGLGLSLSKRLVELHGGKLEIASTPGRGTMVTMRLPAERILEADQGTWVI